MRRLSIIVCIVISAVLTCLAQPSKTRAIIKADDICSIERVNTSPGTIMVAGQRLSVGDRFRAGDKIQWEDIHNSIKVRNMNTGEVMQFCAKEFDKQKDNIYIIKVGTYTKGSNEMSKMLSKTFYMIEDTLFIRPFNEPGPNDGYVIQSIPGGNAFVIPYDDETKDIVIFRQLLESNGIDIVKQPVRFHVEFWHRNEDESISKAALTDKMVIEYVPKVSTLVSGKNS